MIWLKQLHAARKMLLEILDYSEDACDLPVKNGRSQAEREVKESRNPVFSDRCRFRIKPGMTLPGTFYDAIKLELEEQRST
jgi:hypothetical protein